MLNRLITALTFLVAVGSAYNPGVVASGEISMVENHKVWIANFILKALNTVSVPDIPVEDPSVQAYINDNTYHLSNTTMGEVTVLVEPENNAIRFRIDDLMARFESKNFTIIVDGVVTQGTLYADIYKFQAYVGVTPEN